MESIREMLSCEWGERARERKEREKTEVEGEERREIYVTGTGEFYGGRSTPSTHFSLPYNHHHNNFYSFIKLVWRGVKRGYFYSGPWS